MTVFVQIIFALSCVWSLHSVSSHSSRVDGELKRIETAGTWRRYLHNTDRLGDSIATSNETSSSEIPTNNQSGPERVDPLNGLKKYRGGYGIQNKHYWASAVFTGIYGYTIGLAVLLIGLVLFLLLLKRRNWGSQKVTYSLLNSYNVFFVLAFFFATTVALISCGMILAGNKKLNSEANSVEDIIVRAANKATATIYNVTSVMSQISTTLKPYDEQLSSSSTLFSTKDKLYLEALEIQKKVKENKGLIDATLKAINVTVIVISSLTIAVLIVGLVIVEVQWGSQFWKWFFPLVILVFWILTIFSWFAFGFYYMAYNIVEDTCLALKEYRQDPYNSSLGSLFPCVDLKASNDSVLKLREGMYKVILQANRNISRLCTTLDEAEDDKLIPRICNPFSGPPHYKLTGKCVKGTITIGSVPKALMPFRCAGDNEQDCVAAEGRHIPNAIYETILAYTTAAQIVIDATPSLESLTNCSFVVNAFAVIVDEKCGPVKNAVHIVWGSYAGVSTAAVVLLSLYIREIYREKVYLRVRAPAAFPNV